MNTSLRHDFTAINIPMSLGGGILRLIEGKMLIYEQLVFIFERVPYLLMPERLNRIRKGRFHDLKTDRKHGYEQSAKS